jgi:hypothetical protein
LSPLKHLAQLFRTNADDVEVADNRTPLFCRIVECLSEDVFLLQNRNEHQAMTQVMLLKNGDILIRHSGPQDDIWLMPDWPYARIDDKPHIVITGGDCPGGRKN